MGENLTLDAALLIVQSSLEKLEKNAANEGFKKNGRPSMYADLGEVIDNIVPLCNANHIAVLQPPCSNAYGVGVRTILKGYGETLDFGEFTVPLDKANAQGAGSAVTYCRRYSLKSIFGMADEDDDGNSASGVKAAAGRSYGTGEPPAPELASEPQIKAVWGKAKTLGMSEKVLCAAIARDTEGRADHPDKLTKADARLMLDKMQKAIDEKAGK